MKLSIRIGKDIVALGWHGPRAYEEDLSRLLLTACSELVEYDCVMKPTSKLRNLSNPPSDLRQTDGLAARGSDRAGIKAVGSGRSEEVGSQTKPKKIAVLIAGMHRSGTSAVTRVLNLLGCDLPRTLLPPSRNDNELGFWESQPVLELNQEILASAGSTWYDWTPFNPRWHESPVSDGFQERAQSLLEGEFGNSRFFVLKDPRNCRLLPFWIDAIEAFGAEPMVVLPIRNPLEVAASLEKRSRIEFSAGQLCWLRHVLEAERASRHLRRVFLRYDDLLMNWRGSVERVAAALGLSWPRRSATVEREIDTFLSPDHRHNVETDRRVLKDSELSVWIRETFEILSRWARDEIHEGDAPALDRIWNAFEEATPAFERIALTARQAQELNGELAAVSKRLEESKREGDHLAAELGNATQQAQQAQSELARFREQLGAAEQALARHQREAEESAVRQAALEAERKDVATKLYERELRIASLEESLERARDELIQLSQVTGEREAELAELRRRAQDACLQAVMALVQAAELPSFPFVANREFWKRLQRRRKADLLLRCGLFDPAWYLERNPDVGQAGLEPVGHYLDYGLPEGRAPSALFDHAATAAPPPDPRSEATPDVLHYGAGLARLVEAARCRMRAPGSSQEYDRVSAAFDLPYYLLRYADIARSTIVDPVEHYLEKGAREGRDPSPEFSTKSYLARYPDVKESGLNPFYHWLTIGRAEGRLAVPFPDFEGFCEILGRSPKEVQDEYFAQRQSLRRRLEQGALGEMVARAGKLEPLIHQSWAAALDVQVAPLRTEQLTRMQAMHRLHAAAEFRRGKAVVAIRACRVSGAARIAGYLAGALAEIYGPDEIVVVRTDQSDLLFPDWFPATARHVDFAGIAEKVDRPGQQRLLVEFLRSLRPAAVFNVNSRLLWEIMMPYGKALASSTSLYAYLFCNEQDHYGRWIGYPNRNFYRYFDLLQGVITDSLFLAEDLQTRFLVPPDKAAKLVTLHTPVATIPDPAPYLPREARHARPQVFWAGRFDRQKRVDIAYAVAERMPEVEFRMWGEAVLDGQFQHLQTPQNVTLEGVYNDMSELPWECCDVWLYTSEWDGVPNMLIEVAALGVPLVGTIAGGTGDVLVEGLSYRVEQVEDVDAYVAGIRSALADPQGARRRAAELRQLVLQRRNLSAYRAELEKLLARSVV